MAYSKDVLTSLGRSIKARREAMGLAQADLAARGGPGETTISRLERGDGAAPRNQTQEQLEHVLALPPGSVRGFLEAEEKKFAEGPRSISSKPAPLGRLEIFVRDERLAEELHRQLGVETAHVGETLTLGSADLARKALRVAGSTRPVFPLSIVSIDTGAEFVVSNMAEFNNTFYTGRYVLKERVPGMNFRVWEAPSTQDVWPPGRPSEARAGKPTVEQGVEPPHSARRSGTTSGFDKAPLGLTSGSAVSPARRLPSFSRRRVERDGSVWQYKSALSRDAYKVGSLPARFLPLLAALEAVEEAELDQQGLDADVLLFVEEQLLEAHAALMNAVASLADAVVDEEGATAGAKRVESE